MAISERRREMKRRRQRRVKRQKGRLRLARTTVCPRGADPEQEPTAEKGREGKEQAE